jgi:hypothetical protein
MPEMSSHSQLSEYVKQVAEHVNLIYKRLEGIEENVNSTLHDVEKLKEMIEANRAELSILNEKFISQSEFDEFVKRLTQSMKEILLPYPEEREEEKDDE